jgi:hypothetical protein
MKKIIGIFICMLLIVATVLPVTGTLNIDQNKPIFIKDGFSTAPMDDDRWPMHHHDLYPVVFLNGNWSRTFGGNDDDKGYQVKSTSDGGYIIIGSTVSYGSGDIGKPDVWLIKTDENGNEQWNVTFGDEYIDEGYSVQETSDGGYIITGKTWSHSKEDDMWLIKTNANGEHMWDKQMGGEGDDVGSRVEETADNGFIIVGYTSSYGSENNNIWLVKTNDTGVQQWSKTFGENGQDAGFAVHQTSDDGYILTGGYTGDDDIDMVLIKTDDLGNELWKKQFGGGQYDCGYDVQLTRDGGYIVVGDTLSYNDDPGLIVKADIDGNAEWLEILDFYPSGVMQTHENGYAIIGGYYIGVNEAIPILAKTTPSGDLMWEEEFDDIKGFFNSFLLTNDGGYISAGLIDSEEKQEDLILLKRENHKPHIPSITGEQKGEAGKVYHYSFSSIDPDGHDICYNVDWGDGNNEWTGFNPSGEEVTLSHNWSEPDTYTIKAKAKDMYGAESDWAELTVTMPRNRATYNSLFQWFLEQFPILQKILLLLQR